MENRTKSAPKYYRRPVSEEAREHRNAYMRQYRKDHPELTRKWKRNYIIRAAERLLAEEAEKATGGDEA